MKYTETRTNALPVGQNGSLIVTIHIYSVKHVQHQEEPQYKHQSHLFSEAHHGDGKIMHTS